MRNKYSFIFLLLVLIIISNFEKPENLESATPNKEQITELRDRNSRLKEELKNLEEEISTYEDASGEDEKIQELFGIERDNYKKLAGYLDLKGEGIVILMSDSQREKGQFQSINEFIIHDDDVYQILWDLRNAGAEAISVNGERVLFNLTQIICNGPTIRINNRLYSQPFVIRAIGPRKALQAAINVYGSYSDKLRQKGVFIEANTSVMVEVPSYREEPFLGYLEELMR